MSTIMLVGSYGLDEERDIEYARFSIRSSLRSHPVEHTKCGRCLGRFHKLVLDETYESLTMLSMCGGGDSLDLIAFYIGKLRSEGMRLEVTPLCRSCTNEAIEIRERSRIEFCRDVYICKTSHLDLSQLVERLSFIKILELGSVVTKACL